MQDRQPLGPFCQSCGMPLASAEDFGTGPDGLRINDYCRHCYQAGSFTSPGLTMQQMIDRCAAIMGEQGVMPEPQARLLMAEAIPRLKRWQKQ